MNAAAASVDPKRAQGDREHFDKIAEDYTAKDLVASSKCARQLRLERMLSDVPLESTWRVLEVGCGAGFAATYLRGRYGTYLGCDHSQKLIRAAVTHNSGPSVDFLSKDIEDLGNLKKFDLIFMVGVLHHLEEPEKVMATLRMMLGPGGYLAANEPQPSNFLISAARRMRTSFDAQYSDDQNEISRVALRALFSSADLTGITITPQGLFSTPFAEVPMRPDWLVTPISRAACAVDAFIEPSLARFLKSMTWNLTAVGRRSEDSLSENPRDGAIL